MNNNNNDNDGKKSNSIKVINEIGWKQSLFSPFGKPKTNKASDIKMGTLLGNGDAATPEAVTLTTGTVKTRKKSFEIFHWKFMLLSVLFVIGLCGTTLMWFTTIYYEEIFKTLTLGNGTPLHLAWKKPPLEPLLCVHLFNYTNADEYFSDENKHDKKVKLKVQDTGPYCFRETIERQYIQFRKNGTEMSYREQRLHKFDEENSVGSLNDTVIVPNVLILSVYKEIVNFSSIGRFVAYSALNGADAKVLFTTTVEKYLYGYEDNLFTTIGGVHQIFSSDTKSFPKEFGVLKKRKGLSNDTFVIKTGNGNLDDMGQVVEINNITMFNVWTTNTCNLVMGSDGLFFRRSLIQSYQDVHLFHKDACRTLPLQFENIQDLKGGITAYRYKLRPDIFDHSKIENQCYCNASNTCNIRGTLDISSCPGIQGAPIIISRPHFLDSNVNFNKDGEEIIQGMKPDIKKHDFHIDIFPPLGLTVRTLMRMQLNIQIRNPTQDGNLNPIEDKTVLPMVWMEMNSGNDVPEKMYSLLYHLSYTMKWAELVLKWTFLLFTLFMAFILFKMSFVKSSSKKGFFIISKKTKKSNSLVNNVYVPS